MDWRCDLLSRGVWRLIGEAYTLASIVARVSAWGPLAAME
jgi:hypothetical protein